MARGWESKSVEEQQAQSASDREKPRQPLSAEVSALQKRKEGLLLARKNIARQLEAAQNPNHRKVLQDALAALDSQISNLG